MSQVESSSKLDLERIVFIGRTFDEYMAMFSLSVDELKSKTILDCPAGACSFSAVGNRKGLDITACDIAYYHDSNDLKNKGLLDIEHAMEKMKFSQKNYRWNYFRDIEGLRKHRLSALHNCVDDMMNRSERYIPAILPTLQFDNDQFDVVLSAHFLFMYGDRLDYQFHQDTLNELLRVAKEEVRIFPLADLSGQRYAYLDKLIHDLSERGYTCEEETVGYEFQLNANSMLKISK